MKTRPILRRIVIYHTTKLVLIRFKPANWEQEFNRSSEVLDLMRYYFKVSLMALTGAVSDYL